MSNHVYPFRVVFLLTAYRYQLSFFVAHHFNFLPSVGSSISTSLAPMQNYTNNKSIHPPLENVRRNSTYCSLPSTEWMMSTLSCL